jgi:hypothetical protein
MPLPKSVTKISKNGVEFVSSVDRANYLITELTRAAMKDVAKYVLRIVRANVRAISSQTKKMRYAGMRYQYWVRKKECDLQLGIENTKFGAESAWWADQSELGTGNQPKRGFLRAAVYDNIATIRQIESQYLSAIEDEAGAEAMVDEEENNPGADDE